MILGTIVHPLVKHFRGRGLFDNPWWLAPTLASLAPVVAAYILGTLTGRSIWRLFSGLRKQRKIERKVHKEAEAALKEKQRRELQQQQPPPQ